MEVGVTRLADKEVPPPPQPTQRRLAARHALPRQFAARIRAQERLVEIGARATLGKRARSVALLRELRTRSRVLSPTVGATYRPGSRQPLLPEPRRSPRSWAAQEQGARPEPPISGDSRFVF